MSGLVALVIALAVLYMLYDSHLKKIKRGEFAGAAKSDGEAQQTGGRGRKRTVGAQKRSALSGFRV
jgi:hypothetical protein